MVENKILIVDDNVVNLDILIEILDNYDILEATNGADALKIIQSETIDLIILDVIMPHMNGFELCEILKENIKTKDIPIIFITGKVDTQSITKSFEIGGVDYITKPFNTAEVQARVKNHLKLSHTINKLTKLSQDIMINTKFATIGQMATGITHEINTPLTYIKATLEMCQEDISHIKESDIKETLTQDNKTILDGVKRIGIIIDSMKEISSDEKVSKTNVNIYNSILTVLIMIYNRSKLISNIYINGNIFDINDVQKNKVDFYANIQKQKMEQVWTIILNNALDELEKLDNFEQKRIDIIISQQYESINVEIKNNGGVIEQNIIKNIFEPFTTTKEHKGIGIGLSVAKKIIDEHNGDINVKCYDNITSFKIVV